MARHKSAVKAARQAVKRTTRNTAALSKVKTAIKKLKTAIAASAGKAADKKDLLPLLNEAQRTLMKAASKKLLKRATASRQVARLSKAIQRAVGAAAK